MSWRQSHRCDTRCPTIQTRRSLVKVLVENQTPASLVPCFMRAATLRARSAPWFKLDEPQAQLSFAQSGAGAMQGLHGAIMCIRRQLAHQSHAPAHTHLANGFNLNALGCGLCVCQISHAHPDCATSCRASSAACLASPKSQPLAVPSHQHRAQAAALRHIHHLLL